MARTPFKLRSGNSPSPMKLYGISPLKTDPKNKPLDQPEDDMAEEELIEYNEMLDLAKKDEDSEEETRKKKFVRGSQGNVFKY